ncbi:hypothetical protein DFJ73DRAFT_850455 [Zopfochytrium polystomum]|nr:hypothetical protein DFJ73DRAFT_850455 [Zopfochytrium polystomum]
MATTTTFTCVSTTTDSFFRIGTANTVSECAGTCLSKLQNNPSSYYYALAVAQNPSLNHLICACASGTASFPAATGTCSSCSAAYGQDVGSGQCGVFSGSAPDAGVTYSFGLYLVSSATSTSQPPTSSSSSTTTTWQTTTTTTTSNPTTSNTTPTDTSTSQTGTTTNTGTTGGNPSSGGSPSTGTNPGGSGGGTSSVPSGGVTPTGSGPDASNPASNPNAPSSSSGGVSTATIAGIVGGIGAAILVAVAILVLVIIPRNKQRRQAEKAELLSSLYVSNGGGGGSGGGNPGAVSANRPAAGGGLDPPNGGGWHVAAGTPSPHASMIYTSPTTEAHPLLPLPHSSPTPQPSEYSGQWGANRANSVQQQLSHTATVSSQGQEDRLQQPSGFLLADAATDSVPQPPVPNRTTSHSARLSLPPESTPASSMPMPVPPASFSPPATTQPRPSIFNGVADITTALAAAAATGGTVSKKPFPPDSPAGTDSLPRAKSDTTSSQLASAAPSPAPFDTSYASTTSTSTSGGTTAPSLFTGAADITAALSAAAASRETVRKLAAATTSDAKPSPTLPLATAHAATPVASWTPQEVAAALVAEGMDLGVAELFVAHQIDGVVLRTVDSGFLAREMGVGAAGVRARAMMAVARVRGDPAVDADGAVDGTAVNGVATPFGTLAPPPYLG